MSAFDDEIEELMVNNNPTKRNQDCYKNYKSLALHFINEGFKAYEAKQRREARTHFKKEIIKPEFMAENYRPPKPIVRVKVSERTVTHAVNHATDMFIGWKIGRLEIGQATKDKLLAEARNEHRAGAGHIINALIYERLAQPMNNRQTVAEYWKSPEAIRVIRDQVVNEVNGRRTGIADNRPTV